MPCSRWRFIPFYTDVHSRNDHFSVECWGCVTTRCRCCTSCTALGVLWVFRIVSPVTLCSSPGLASGPLILICLRVFSQVFSAFSKCFLSIFLLSLFHIEAYNTGLVCLKTWRVFWGTFLFLITLHITLSFLVLFIIFLICVSIPLFKTTHRISSNSVDDTLDAFYFLFVRPCFP